MATRIKELTTLEELQSGFHIMKQLRHHLTEEKYLELVTEMLFKGYKTFALYENETMVSLTAFVKDVNLYYGRHAWIDELVTDEKFRSRGFGKILLKYVFGWAKENSCECVVLSSGLTRVEAHKFYLDKMGMKKVSHVFMKVIEDK